MATNSVSTQLNSATLRLPQVTRRWFPLAGLLVLALFARMNYMADPAYRGDLRHFAYWLYIIDQRGALQFYEPQYRMGVWDRTYPPLSTLTFAGLISRYGSAPDPRIALNHPDFVVLLKIVPVLAELALIAAVYFWLSERPLLRWLIPGSLALFPGLIATSAWWGQYDAPFTLFLVLALICLNRDVPIVAWIMFAIAVLLKQPALVLGPLLLVITYKRYGWRQAVLGLAVSGALCAVVIAPFALGSGLENALAPYLKAGDAYPFLSNNAYNFWYAVGSLQHHGIMVQFQDKTFSDSLPLIAGISYKDAAFLMFGAFVVGMLVVVWRQAHERREFVWAAALFFGFFMLPTQVHERYLYPAAILLIVAIAQEHRIWWVALGVIGTFSYNILAVLVPTLMRDAHLMPEQLALPVAIANVGLFVMSIRYAAFLPVRFAQPRFERQPEPVAAPALNAHARNTRAQNTRAHSASENV